MKKGLWMMAIACLLVACGSDSGSDTPDVAGDDTGGADLVEPQEVTPEIAADLADPEETVEPMDVVVPDVSDEEWQTLYGTECALEERIGTFTVVYNLGGGETLFPSFKGWVQSHISPSTVLIEEDAQGGCRLYSRANPECTPACNTQSEQCNLDEQCEPNPTNTDLGQVVVAGLTTPTVLDAPGNNEYQKFDYPNEPIFVPGSHITLTAEGGDFEPIELQGQGVEPLVMAAPSETIDPEAALPISWEPSDGPGEIIVQVSLGNHATTPLTIICTPEDTGSLTVPADYVVALMQAYVAGTVTGTVMRRTVDAESYKTGCVEFQVYSDKTWDMKLPE